MCRRMQQWHWHRLWRLLFISFGGNFSILASAGENLFHAVLSFIVGRYISLNNTEPWHGPVIFSPHHMHTCYAEIGSHWLSSTQWTTEVTACGTTCCICFQWQAPGWEPMTSQDVFTMTGCRCPELAGREANFKDHFVSRHSPFLTYATTHLTGVDRGTARIKQLFHAHID